MKNKLLSVFLASIIAVSIMGIAYADWVDQVTITGTLETGCVNVGIVETSITHWESTNGFDERDFVLPKPWVCDATITPGGSYSECGGESVYKTLDIFIDNGYPCWDLHVLFRIKNVGCVPVILTGYAPLVLPDFMTYGFVGLPPMDTPPDFRQLDEGEYWDVELWLHFEQDTPECAGPIDFSIVLDFVQWNMAAV